MESIHIIISFACAFNCNRVSRRIVEQILKRLQALYKQTKLTKFELDLRIHMMDLHVQFNLIHASEQKLQWETKTFLDE
jgi:hypothetical protein